MKNPKAKGNSFERVVSEKISLWLTNNKEKRAAWRTSTSGGISTIWAKKNEEANFVSSQAGDITRIIDKGLFNNLDSFFDTYIIECKAYKAIDLYPPFNSIISSFFDSCINAKKQTGKKAILICKANNRKVLFCSETPHKNLSSQLILNHKDLTFYVYLFDEVITKPYEEFSTS